MRKLLLLAFVALSTFAKAQVNPQTGSAVFSLPMFEWHDNKSRLNLNVSLNYSSGSGLKVNDIASNAGVGWNLLAGGVITRMQVGEPDDQMPYHGNSTPEDITKYPAGFLYAQESPNSGCPQGLARYPLYGDKNHIYKEHNLVAEDRERDQFAFQFNGRSGLFVLAKNNNDKAVLIGDSKLKIWYDRNENNVSNNIRTTIVSFYVQDENGLIYKFSNYELTKVLNVHFSNNDGTIKYTQPKFEDGKVYHEGSFDEMTQRNLTINSWYLSEIEDALTHRKIYFGYNTRNIEAKATGIAYHEENDYSIISHTRSVTQTPVINNVTFPDGHLVTFNYGAERADLDGDFALSGVHVSYYGRILSRFSLTTAYFILNRYGMPSSDYQKKCARLCLLSVKRIGVDSKAEEQPYVFDYYTGAGAYDDIVPPPYFHMKDIWGYYNGTASVSYNNNTLPFHTPLEDLYNEQVMGLCFIRAGTTNIALNPKTAYAKNGLLKKINYPAGGTLIYEYLQNYGVLGGQHREVGGVHVSKTLASDGGYSNDCDHPVTTNYSYVLEGSNNSSLWGLEEPKNWNRVFSFYSAKDKYFYWKPVLTFGCDWKFKYPGIQSREQAISLTSMQQFMNTLTKVLDIVSGVMQIVDVVNLCLAATPAAIAAVVIDIIATVFSIVLSCTADGSDGSTATTHYNADLNGNNPLPQQFKRVEVSGSPGGYGKTILEFTSSDDYAIWEPTNAAMSMKQRFAPWAYGLPKKTIVKDDAGNKIKETEYVYDFSAAKYTYSCVKCPPMYDPSCKCLITRTESQKYTEWQDPNIYAANYVNSTNTDITVEKYLIWTGRVLLEHSYERNFKPGSSTQYLETATQYEYNDDNWQPSQIRTKQSNGDENFKQIRYTVDFSTGELNTMKLNNILNVPVVVTTHVAKANSNNFLFLEEDVTEFTTLASGDIKPYRSLRLKFDEAKIASQVGSYIEPNDPYNPTYKIIQTFYYDAYDNVSGMRDEGDRLLTNIYDYNDKYIVASVVNADPVLDKVAYSSFETATLGGWTLSGTAAYNSTAAVTGLRSFALASQHTLSSAVSTSKEHILSFWANNFNVVIGSGAILTKVAPTINGFTYFEYVVPSGSSNVTVTGTASIDELRLYPRAARMRTVTYDPLIGKTSECDENNRATYYEYDALSRLQMVRDDKRNIIKMYEYNYADARQTPAGCIITYANKAISEIFKKDDCDADHLGSTVEYTIPAGTYTSTISQAAADMQAQYQLDTYGQDYANANGTCQTLYFNTVQSETFTKQCDFGYTGTSITYTVPARRYRSLISQADADQQALDEIEANGQAYVNLPGNASCVLSNTPIWILTGNEECRSGHRFVEVKDENPNSSTYNQLQWVNKGPDSTCPPANYSITQNSCSGAFNTYTVNGRAGDVIELELSFSGVVAWTSANGGAGATISLSGGGQSCSDASAHTTNTFSTGFNISCTITFTMPSNSVIINTGAVIHNSTITTSAGASLRVKSIYGTPNDTQSAVCYGNSSGNW